MGKYILVATVFLILGIGIGRYLPSGSVDDSEQIHYESVAPSNTADFSEAEAFTVEEDVLIGAPLGTASQTQIIDSAGSDDELKPWFEKNYSNNWGELFSKVMAAGNNQRDLRRTDWLLDSMSAEDLQGMIQAALQSPDRAELDGLLGAALWRYASKNPEEAIALFPELSPEEQKRISVRFVRNLAQTDPMAAWDWLNSYDQEGKILFETAMSRNSYKAGVILAMAQKPEYQDQAFQLAKSEDEMLNRRSLVRRVADQMARRDVNASLEFALAMPKDEVGIRDATLNKVLDVWSKQDPFAAAQYLASNSDLASRGNLVNVTEQLIVKEGVSEFRSLYDQVGDNKIKDAMAARAVERLASRDLDAAIEWANLIGESRDRKRAGYGALKEMGFKDNMQDHLRFIEQGYANQYPDQKDLYTYSLKEWQKVYPAEVEQYVNSLTEPQLRADLIRNLRLD